MGRYANRGASILRPSVVDFLELSIPGRDSEVDLEEIRIEQGILIIGMSIAAIEERYTRIRIVALKRRDQPISMIPDPKSNAERGDFLVTIGEASSLKRLGGEK
jgi:K+/H+ antiporter YhaU regulatory subunit KhtT